MYFDDILYQQMYLCAAVLLFLVFGAAGLFHLLESTSVADELDKRR